MKRSPRPPATTPTGGKSSKPTAKEVKAARPMTKRQLSRHQRDLRLQRITRIGFSALFVALALIIGFGYWRENIAPASEVILRVRGVPITTETYAKVLGYNQYEIDLQIANIQAFASRPQAGGDEQNAALVQQFAQQQIQYLQQQRATLETQVLDQMANDEFIRQESVKRGINVTPADVDAEIYKPYAPAPQQSNPVTGTEQAPGASTGGTVTGTETQPGGTAGVTGTAAAPSGTVTNTQPQPTPTPITQQQAIADTMKRVNESGLLTEQEYRDLIVKPTILRDRLEALLSDEVPATAEQVWARHILVDNEDAAKDVLTKLQGGADFAALAKEVSTDSGTKDKGGDLGWFTRGAMQPEFEQAAFGLQVGETVTQPVKTSYGYHIIQVLGHEQNRSLSSDQLQTAKGNALSKWLQQQRDDDPKAVEYGYSWERLKWARDWIANHAKYLQANQAPSQQ